MEANGVWKTLYTGYYGRSLEYEMQTPTNKEATNGPLDLPHSIATHSVLLWIPQLLVPRGRPKVTVRIRFASERVSEAWDVLVIQTAHVGLTVL